MEREKTRKSEKIRIRRGSRGAKGGGSGCGGGGGGRRKGLRQCWKKKWAVVVEVEVLLERDIRSC